MRLLEQARSCIASAINNSKSTPLARERSESSNSTSRAAKSRTNFTRFSKGF